MNHTQMSEVISKIMKEVNTMRNAGQKEYAHNVQDVFANFNRISDLLQIDRKKVLMTYMLKHVDGIAAYTKGHKSQREDVTGRITDCIVYLTLLWGMIEEDEHGLITNKQVDKDVRDVLKAVKSNSVSMDRGLRPPNGTQSESDLQKVRKTRNRIQEPQEVGTT